MAVSWLVLAPAIKGTSLCLSGKGIAHLAALDVEIAWPVNVRH